MAAVLRRLLHVPAIEKQTWLRPLGVSRADEDLWADSGAEIRKPKGGRDFLSRSGEESAPAGRVQRQTGRVLLQGPRVREKQRFLSNSA